MTPEQALRRILDMAVSTGSDRGHSGIEALARLGLENANRVGLELSNEEPCYCVVCFANNYAQCVRGNNTRTAEYGDIYPSPIWSPEVMSGWFPIWTMPKNGQFLVALDGIPDLSWPAYRTDGGNLYSNAHGLLNEQSFGRIIRATHWRPALPRPY